MDFAIRASTNFKFTYRENPMTDPKTAMLAMKDLLPCPFCNGAASFKIVRTPNGDGADYWSAGCQLRSEESVMTGCGVVRYGDTKEEAALLWNTLSNHVVMTKEDFEGIVERMRQIHDHPFKAIGNGKLEEALAIAQKYAED